MLSYWLRMWAKTWIPMSLNWLHDGFHFGSSTQWANLFFRQEDRDVAWKSTSKQTCTAAGRVNASWCGCPGSADSNMAVGWDGHRYLIFCLREILHKIVPSRYVIQQLQNKVCKFKDEGQLERVGTVLEWPQELVKAPGKQTKEVVMAWFDSCSPGLPTHFCTHSLHLSYLLSSVTMDCSLKSPCLSSWPDSCVLGITNPEKMNRTSSNS